MFIKLYLIAFSVFLVVDMVWLTLVAKNFYAQQIGHLMSTKVNFVAALLFYVLFIGGVVYFVLMPALAQDSWKVLLFNGALFGLLTYATYDLTNLATLKDWPILVTVVDLIWGTTLSTTVGAVTFYIAQKLGL